MGKNLQIKTHEWKVALADNTDYEASISKQFGIGEEINNGSK